MIHQRPSLPIYGDATGKRPQAMPVNTAGQKNGSNPKGLDRNIKARSFIFLTDKKTCLYVLNTYERHQAVHTFYIKSSPYFICTSFTYLRTNEDESPFLQINNTLSFSATI